jgi:uncharacterized membrane protein YraQ (UPF0718 family)
MIGAERLLWQGVIFGVVCSLILTALLLGTVGKGSTAAFWLLLPAVWLTNTIIGTQSLRHLIADRKISS